MTDNKKKIHVGVDIGGTKIALGLVTAEGECLQQKKFPTQRSKGADWLIAHVIHNIRELVQQAGLPPEAVASVGIGVPGTVEAATGNVVLAPSLGWQNVQMGRQIKTAFPAIPVYIEQDTKTAVLGEYFLCADPSVSHLLFITISTGIGSGLILDRKLYRGQLNSAGEIGHCIVERNGLPCSCGNRGCLQAYADGTAIAGAACQRIKHGEQSTLTEVLSNGRLTALQVASAAEQGDSLARDVLLRAAEYVGIALANVISLLNLDLIIIGGGVAQSGAGFIEKIREVAENSCYPPARGSFRIVVTTHWDTNAIIGAGLLHNTAASENWISATSKAGPVMRSQTANATDSKIYS
ncbi:hypothetical protein CSB45_05970 [candidate division KSB3 bacterium]|uniref:Glucokinase n=1 Tax=candidate division KSB3 bacterium TaxID=2044937 RepID=A0A2G6E7N6_9BACT|nr:MAG: hypothetical protein CSB45_05970 [candidate division KSB3 bacterium]PIE30196.1 MAG: hypothetical protein CSA57_04685 [candidate division KSB3 bacterium]